MHATMLFKLKLTLGFAPVTGLITQFEGFSLCCFGLVSQSGNDHWGRGGFTS